jgi:hypothetical protein
MLVHQVAKLPGMPSASTIYSWIDKHAEFAVMYEAAMMARFDLTCEELLAIAKGEKEEVVTTTEEDGKTTTKTVSQVEPVDRSKVRVDTLKWIMTKRLPRIYGSRRGCRAGHAARVRVRSASMNECVDSSEMMGTRRPSASLSGGLMRRNADSNITERE